MPSKTGYWSQEEAKDNHDFSYQLAKFIGQYLPKKELIVDFGCGPGEYLRYLHDIGFENLLGLEGEPLTNSEFGKINKQDLTEPFLLEEKGHIICLEVGEHIPEEYIKSFLDNIELNLKPKGILILSWAEIDQDGYSHVSCRQNVWVINEAFKRNLTFIPQDTIEVRSRIENRFSYFKRTILIFKKS